MPHNEDPGRSSRPSLLSDAPPQPAAGDDQSILSKLDGKTGAPKGAAVPRRPGRLGGMAAGIAAVVVLAGGALAWSMQDHGDAGVTVSAAAPAAAPAAVPAPAASAGTSDTSGPGAPATAAAEPAPAAESEVSAATILDEMPGAATAAAVAAGATAAVARAPGATDTRGGKDELVALLDKHAPADKVTSAKAPDEDTPAVKKTSPTKAERKAKAAREKKAALAAAKKKKKPPVKSAPETDNDAALLAALLAHSKASGTTRDSKPATDAKRCATPGGKAGADKCRERPCEGAAKAKNDCKPAVAEISG